MLPVLIDLSGWKPLGISLDSVLAKTIAFLILAAAGYAFGAILSRRRGRTSRLWSDPASLLCVLALAVVGVGLVWVVSKVHSYGLMMALGFIVAMGVARIRIRRVGEDPEVISNVGILALVGGVVGSRIAYIIEHYENFARIHPDGTPPSVSEQIIEMFKLTSGGLVFDGGLVLAIVLVLGYLYFKRLPVRRFLDVLAVSVMVGLAFGRVGCTLNGCCYGEVCSEDFALGVHFPYCRGPLVYPHTGENPYPPGAVPSPVYAQQFHLGEVDAPTELLRPAANGGVLLKSPDELHGSDEIAAAVAARARPAHPTQIYAIANALLLAGLLAAVSRLRTREGQVFAMLLVFYPLTRFILEFIRDDNPGMAITPAQVKCLIFAAVGGVILLALKRLPASCGPALAERLALAEAAKTAEQSASRKRRKKH